MEDLDGILELDKTEGIYIDIGTRVYLEIDGVDFSVTSIFIGLLKDEFMMVTFPQRYKSVKNKLFNGNKMVVKYLYDGSVFAFQTSVIETITNPIRAIALEYPRVVQERELRVVKRNNVIIPSRVEAKKTEFRTVVFDISKHGVRFKYNENKGNFAPLREGDILRVFCQFPGVSNEIGCMATVRNVAREKGQISIGAEFNDITDDFLNSLMHFLYSIEDFA